MSQEDLKAQKVAKREMEVSEEEEEETTQKSKRQKKLPKEKASFFDSKTLSDTRYMAMAATESCLVLRLIAEAFQKFVSNANFDWDENGLRMSSMGMSNVTFTSLELKASGFTEGFRCERPISLGINFETMYRLFGNRRKAALALLVPRDSDSLRFVFREHGKSKISNFTMNLLDIDSHIFNISGIDYQTIVRIPSRDLTEIFREFAHFGDNISFSGQDGQFVISAKGDDGKAEMVLHDGRDGVEIEKCVPSRTKYPTKYLEMFSKAMAITDVVELRLDARTETGETMPLCVVCRIPNDAGELLYYVAPRIDEAI